MTVGQTSPTSPLAALAARLNEMAQRISDLERAAQRNVVSANVTVDPTGWSTLTATNLQSVLDEIDAAL